MSSNALRVKDSLDQTNDWNSPPTTPLRIAKRGSPARGAQLSRRQSSSYNHLKRNNLVSRSPFKSQLPVSSPAKPMPLLTPTRRVSGEKRPRPAHDQAENEHPLGFKRRQSKAFQGLLEKEPVTKSPFRRPASDEMLQPPPIKPIAVSKYRKKPPAYDELGAELAPPPPPKQVFSPRNSPSPSRVPNPNASPARPSLVSRRLHGPRDSYGSRSRKARRKTVSFSEQCDILMIDNVSLDEDAFDWVTDEDTDHDQHDDNEPRFISSNDLNDSDDGSQADDIDGGDDGDDSITGMVDSMLQDASTPPPDNRLLPEDLETEDGVPYGRTHHAERAAAAHRHLHDNGEDEDEEMNNMDAPTLPFPRPPEVFSTPPQSRHGTPAGPVSPGSHMPLGRSTHSERVKAHKEDEIDVERDVEMLPPSPSPSKRTSTLPSHMDTLVPKFNLDISGEAEKTGVAHDQNGGDPFAISRVKDEPRSVDISFEDGPLGSGGATPPLSVPRKIPELGHRASAELDLDSPPPPGRLGQYQSGSLTRTGSPLLGNRHGSPGLGIASRNGSPLQFSNSLQRGLVKSASASNLSSPSSPHGSLSGRSPRISREEIQRKLLKKRSMDSPLREVINSSDFSTPLTPRSQPNSHTPEDSEEDLAKPTLPNTPETRAAPPLSRPNPTYDGVMSIDPDPQPIDPPRPTIPARSYSTNGIPSEAGPSTSNGFTGLTLDFQHDENGMGKGFGMSFGDIPLGDMQSGLERLMANVAGGASLTTGPDGKSVVMGLKIEAVTAGIQAGQFKLPSDTSDKDSIMDSSDEEGDRMDIDKPEDHSPVSEPDIKPPARNPISRPEFSASAPDLSYSQSSISPPPPAPPPKDAIRQREELIRQKRREARKREEQGDEDEDMDMDFRTPPLRTAITLGRPPKQRSHSTSDAEVSFSGKSAVAKGKMREGDDGVLLNVTPVNDEDPLSDSIDRELRKRGAARGGKYRIREHSETIYASSDTDRITNTNNADEPRAARAWRTVKRPSDVNEYAKQVKEWQKKEGDDGKKLYGKVFIKALGIKNLNIPIPEQSTAVSLTLNNGVHFVTTPETRLKRNTHINQEFEVIEMSKLEITFSVKVRRDPHITAQFKANTAPPPKAPVQPPPPASKGGGMRNFFRSAPKKVQKPSTPPLPPQPVHRLQENLARYLTPDGTLARAFIKFGDIVKHCDAHLFETSFPLIGQKLEANQTSRNVQIGELVLQVFRLPPLPGLSKDQLPQSLEECHRGLRNIKWHKDLYIEGTLTQMGGDCMSWRRRSFRVRGGDLIAFSDVTKRPVATIDLRKAISVEDDQEPQCLSPASGSTARTSRYLDEYDCPFGVERSFRLIFPHNEEIIFYTDTDEDKIEWLRVFRTLIGQIPPKPLWAELLWQLSERQTGTPNNVISPRS